MAKRGFRKWRASSSFADWLLVGGFASSIALALVLDLTGVSSTSETLLIGLVGSVISLQVDMLARAERNAEFARVLKASDWFLSHLERHSACALEIRDRYEGTMVEREAERAVDRLGIELEDLRLGRFRKLADDYEYLIEQTRACKETLSAVTNVSSSTVGNPNWWSSGVGRIYWEENLSAMNRNVTIERVFIYRDLTMELQQLAASQQQAGVHVYLASQDHVPKDCWINFAIWDKRSTWEAHLNAEGAPIANIFSLSAFESDRLLSVFKRVWLAAGTTALPLAIEQGAAAIELGEADRTHDP